MMMILMMACSPDETQNNGVVGSSLEEYHMMSEANSWTYRDDMPADSSTMPDEALLMLAQNDGGMMNLRRGSRWIEASPAGSIEWDLEDGLSLVSWDLPNITASGPIRLSYSEFEVGDAIEEGDWSCELSRPESMWTWYAEFDDVLYFACDSSSESLHLFFGKRSGLIQLSHEYYELDLVAPW